jgi:hypothetical protein
MGERGSQAAAPSPEASRDIFHVAANIVGFGPQTKIICANIESMKPAVSRYGS